MSAMNDDELKALFDTFREENVAAHAETRHMLAETADLLRQENAETRHLFQVTAEQLRHEIQLVAEGVTDTREMLSREAADIREELQRTTDETQALIKYSYAELDRRVSALEQAKDSV